MTRPFNWLTAADLECVPATPKITVQIATVVRQRLRLCGLHKPSAQTRGHLAGLIAVARELDMTLPRLHVLGQA